MNRRSFLGLRNRPPLETAGDTARALSPYQVPLTRAEARHLVSRLEFGARLRRVNGFIGLEAAEAVQFILNEAEENALPEAPDWYKNRLSGNTDDLYNLQKDWLRRMREQGFIEKMTLFLHNHLVTGYPVYERPFYAYTYYRLLRTYALGNFKELIHKIGLDPAMMFYLDNVSNVKTSDEQGNPAGSNENYARELLELFTMGQYGPGNSLNYTEGDIKQIARILTGWQVDDSRFRTEATASLHDSGNKTVFGKTFAGNADPQDEYDRLIDFLFENRGPQIAHYLCRKLYAFFVDPMPDEAFIAGLAQDFVNSNYEFKPVLQKLFTSTRFFDAGLRGARIKCPVDFLVGFLNETETAPTGEVLEFMRVQLEPARLSMELFNPPNVAGWPGLNPPDSAGAAGDEKWLTTSLLPERWNIISELTGGAAGDFDPVEVAIKVSDPANPFKIAEDLARTMVPVPLDIASIRIITDPFAGDPDLPPPSEVMDDPIVSNVSKVMLGDMPHYEWPNLQEASNDQKRGAKIVLQNYIALLSRELPEYQLH